MVLSDVPENMTFVGIPARKLEAVGKFKNFDPYGIGDGKIDDPNKKSINALFKEIHQLTEKINDLQSKIDISKNKELVSSVIKEILKLKGGLKKSTILD